MKTKHILFILLGVGLLIACEKSKQAVPITYPEKGDYGQNILADGFVSAEMTDSSRLEYSLRAILPAGNSNLKIVIKNGIGYNQGTGYNWIVTNTGSIFTFTLGERGKYADASIIFVDSVCTVEYYENGAVEPTKIKEIKVLR